MAGPVSVLAPGVQAAGVPATAKVTANTRVLAMAGPVGILSDVMQFPGPPVVGNWVVGAARVLANGVPVVTASSTGTSFGAPVPPPPPTGPMVVTQGDPRLQAS